MKGLDAGSAGRDQRTDQAQERHASWSSTTACSRPTAPIRSRRKTEVRRMNFTDIFIRQPVLATTVSLLILVLGLRSMIRLPVNQYPRTENSVVTISTAYYGADAQTVAGFHHATARRRDRAGAGHRLPVVEQLSGISTITATLRLNYDANRALTEINTQVNSVRNQLPPAAQQPVLTVQDGPDDRRHVHGLLQRHVAQQQRHRLPGARRQAQARFDRGRADRRNSWRAPSSRCAHGSIRSEWRHTASPRPTCPTRSPATTISRRSA